MSLPKRSVQAFAAIVLSFSLATIGACQTNAAKRTELSNSIVPLRRAHAHNDYLHDHPLKDALESGFCSVEADIFLVEGELLLGHYRWSVKNGRSLKKLYLDPLKKRVEKNGGRVFRNGPVFTLLVDIKNSGDQVYPILKEQLNEYETMLSGLRDGKYEERAIQIVISGSCPRDLIKNDRQRLVSIDGRLSDLDSATPSHLIPMISAKWGSTFKWRGKSKITVEESEKLNSIIKRAHAKNRRVRFWASPELESVWQRQYQAGVDHINTDELARLQKFLLSKQQRK